jgi:hypothetical protein
MANPQNPNDKTPEDESQQAPKSGPSGATDKPAEREKKFEDEGGGQPQGISEDPDDEPHSMGSEGTPHSDLASVRRPRITPRG